MVLIGAHNRGNLGYKNHNKNNIDNRSIGVRMVVVVIVIIMNMVTVMTV